MHDETDETIERIAAALRPLPDVDPAQKARVLVAVAAERERARRRGARTRRVARWIGTGSTVLAAGLVGALWLRGGAATKSTPAPIASIASQPAAVPSPAAATANAQLAA